MFSEKAKKNADACRFCWMCRHLCPVQLVTGKETNTPRAKGLLVSMMERGLTMDRDSARTMYECLLCGACTNDCATGFDPLVFIREARTEAVVNGLEPDCVRRVLDRIEETGCLYADAACRVDLSGVPETGETLLWLGETARCSVPQAAQALMSILKKAQVPFAVMKNEPASGCAMGDLMGFVEEVRAAAKTAAKAIAASGARRVIVLDSYDAAMMRHEYKDWGIDLPEIVTATAFVDGLIQEGRLRPEQAAGLVTYHDGSRLARDLDEHEPARRIIAAMGFEVKEMFQNRRLARDCGSAVFGQIMPETCAAVAESRWQDALRIGVKTIVTACPQSTEALAKACPPGAACQDLFVLLDSHLK